MPGRRSYITLKVKARKDEPHVFCGQGIFMIFNEDTRMAKTDLKIIKWYSNEFFAPLA